MSPAAINVEQVSKAYTLGLARVSLPSLVSSWIGRARRSTRGSAGGTEFWALRDVSFAVQRGESLALIGSNGAGKTTILKLLARITRPSSGTVRTTGTLSALIELGAGFHPDLTGRENIFLNGTILGLTRRQIASRFDAIVDFAGLERFIDTPVKRYSSGMAVRLGFAVASCIEPDILLVDEVLAVGDAAFQQKCLKRIRALIDRGTSIVFVSHNFYLVQAVCDRALYLQEGRVKQQGPTKDVIDAYEGDLHLDRARRFDVGPSGTDLEDADIEITAVDVVNRAGSPADVYHSGQSVQIRIGYLAHRPIGPVHVSVFIMRSDGVTCCMMRTKLDDYSLAIDRGHGMVSLAIEPIQLVSGTYYVEASFLNDDDAMVITAKAGRSAWFSVKSAGLGYEESAGVFVPNRRWHHHVESGLLSTPGALPRIVPTGEAARCSQP